MSLGWTELPEMFLSLATEIKIFILFHPCPLAIESIPVASEEFLSGKYL